MKLSSWTGTAVILAVIVLLVAFAEWNEASCAAIMGTVKPLRCRGFMIPDDEIHPALKLERSSPIAVAATAPL